MDGKDLQNRFDYHPPTEDKKKDHSDLRASFLGIATEVDEVCPDSRELSLAITHLEEAMFWSNAAIARNR